MLVRVTLEVVEDWSGKQRKACRGKRFHIETLL